DQVNAARTDVADIQQELAWQLPLHIERPLLQVWDLPRRIEVGQRDRQNLQLAAGGIAEARIVNGDGLIERRILAGLRSIDHPPVVENAVSAPDHRSVVLRQGISEAHTRLERVMYG